MNILSMTILDGYRINKCRCWKEKDEDKKNYEIYRYDSSYFN